MDHQIEIIKLSFPSCCLLRMYNKNVRIFVIFLVVHLWFSCTFLLLSSIHNADILKNKSVSKKPIHSPNNTLFKVEVSSNIST